MPNEFQIHILCNITLQSAFAFFTIKIIQIIQINKKPELKGFAHN